METSKTTPTKRRLPRKWLILGIATATLVIGGAAVLVAGAGAGRDLLADLPKATATRGELVVSIVETGEVQAQKKTTIANNLRWEAVIVSRVEEGTHVNTGDVIIRFDCQALLEAIDRTALDVAAAENSYQQAMEQIELTQKEWINRVAQAKAEVENQQNNVRKFGQHERKQLLDEAKSQLALAQQDLELSEGKLQFMESVNQTPGLEGTYSLSTVKAEGLRVDRLKLSLSNAQAEVQKLEIYELPREERRLELALADASLELERAELESKAQRRLASVNEEAKRSALAMQKRRLEELQGQRELLEIRAEAPGVIIYDSGNHWDPPDLSIGALVRSRVRLMRIPDMSTLCVYSKVFEGVSEKVQLGMPATIRLDSREDQVLTGRVAHIALLASSEDRRYNPNVKVFPIEVELDEIPEGLKPGSSAQVELILYRLPDVLTVKIAAVFTEQERTYVWRVDSGLAYRTEVTIGEISDTQVQILSGLNEGDTVLMAPPPDEVAVTPDSWAIEVPAPTDQMPSPPEPMAPQAQAEKADDSAAAPDADGAESTQEDRPRRQGAPRPAGAEGRTRGRAQ